MFELTGAPTRVSGQQAPAGELPRCCACLIERFRGTLKHGPTKVQAFSPGTVSDTKWIEHVEAPVTFTKSEGVFCSLFVSLVCLFVCLFCLSRGFQFRNITRKLSVPLFVYYFGFFVSIVWAYGLPKPLQTRKTLKPLKNLIGSIRF